MDGRWWISKGCVNMHLTQDVFKIVSWLLYWMSVHPFISCHNDTFIFGETLDLLLYIASLMCASIVASVTCKIIVLAELKPCSWLIQKPEFGRPITKDRWRTPWIFLRSNCLTSCLLELIGTEWGSIGEGTSPFPISYWGYFCFSP